MKFTDICEQLQVDLPIDPEKVIAQSWERFSDEIKSKFPFISEENLQKLIFYKKSGRLDEYKKLLSILRSTKDWKDKRQDPEFLKKLKVYRARQLEKFKQKYHSDPEFKEKINLKHREKYQNNPEYRQKQKELHKNWMQAKMQDPEYAEKIRARQQELRRLRKQDPEAQEKLREYNRQYRRKQKERQKLGTFNQFVQDKSVSDQIGSL